MNNLSYHACLVDLELRKKLKELLDMHDKAKAAIDSGKLSPLEQLNTESALHVIDESIGKIRFHALDPLGVLNTPEGKNEDSKTNPTMLHKQSDAPGSFSVAQQQDAGLANTVGYPEKVNPVEEGKKRNLVSQNKENAFEKEMGFVPDMDDDAFYKSIDNLLGINVEQKMDLIGKDTALPRGTKTIAQQSEFKIYHGLRNAVNKWFDGVQKDTDPYSALENLKKELYGWNHIAKTESADTVQELYERGQEAGIKKGLKTPPGKSMRHMVHKANEIGPALDNFRDECYSNLSRIMKRHIHDGEHALYREKREIDSWLRKQRWQTRLMVKTEVAKMANFGLLEAWSMDADKYMYNYFWEAIDDDRTKEISRLRKSGNPYTADEITWLWNHQKQFLGKYWQNDAYNQRCHISRQRIDKAFTGNRFLGREAEFESTM
jgi:hypothetical protein